MLALSVAHPPAGRLAAYGRGQLADADAAAVEAHVRGCAACARRLDALPPDRFVAALRGAAATPPPAEPPTVPAPPAAGDPLPRELVAHPKYRVRELLGRGGMGAVYRAEHALMDRPVALKVIAPRLLEQPGAADRFRQEVRAAARLHHPNIVAAFDAEHVGPVTVLAMEYVEGRTLADVLHARGPLPAAAACDHARQAALGLAHAHALGMVHRDVKPANLMLTPDGRVKILDFGLARFVAEGVPEPAAAADTVPTGDPTLTATGACMGTLDYVAPEQADDARTADARADVYALGATLYHLLAGRVPFHGGGATEKLYRLAVADPTPLAAIRPDLPAGLVRVVERMMAKRPADRFPTADAAAAALAPFAAGRPPRRRRRLVLAGLLVAAVVAAAAVIRLKTERGEVVIETDDPDVEVVVKGDRIVTIRDPKTGRSYVLDRADLTLAEADGGGFQVTLDGSRPVVLKRDGARIAAVRLERPSPGGSGKPTGEVRRFEGHVGTVWAADVSPDGTRAVSGGHDGAVRVWDVASGRELVRLGVPTGRVRTVAFSRDGQRVLVCGLKEVSIWDLKSNTAAHRFLHPGPVHSAAFTPDGRSVLTGDGGAGVVRVWDVATGRVVHQFTGHTDAISALALSPDGRRALSASHDETVRLWDVETGRALHTFLGHAAWVESVAFSPDGRRGLSAGRDGTVRLWDLDACREVYALKGPTSWLSAVAFLPDGRHAVAGGWGVEQTHWVWDLESRAVVAQYHSRTGAVLSLAPLPDGRHVLSANNDATVHLWRLPDAVAAGR